MRSMLVELPRARHRPDWKGWQQLTAKAPPYLSPEFFALASRFSGDGALIAEAWDDERLIGALPLTRNGDRLVALSCDYTPGYDYCGAPEGVEAIWHALREDNGWNQLVLGKVPVDALLASRLPTLANADGCPVVIRLDSRHPYFALPRFEVALSSRFRANLRRCARKAAGIELEKVVAPDRATFDQALAIEAMAWKGVAGTSIATAPRTCTVRSCDCSAGAGSARCTSCAPRAGGSRCCSRSRTATRCTRSRSGTTRAPRTSAPGT
jgi:hypothetical protein